MVRCIMMLAWMLTVVAGRAVSAAILFVPDHFQNPQSALDAANSGDTVIFRSGFYEAPLSIPARDITVGSEYILEPNESFIAGCVVRPGVSNPNVRCFDTEATGGVSFELDLVGLTLQEAYAAGSDGGGIRIRNRMARVSNCVFKNCAASYGGAMFIDSSNLVLKESLIAGCDVSGQGRCFYAHASTVRAEYSTFSSSSAIMPNSSHQSEMIIDDSELFLSYCVVRNMGNSTDGRSTIILLSRSSVSDSMCIVNCLFEDNTLNKFTSGGSGTGMRTFVLDSCRIVNNAIAFGFLVDSEFDSLERAVITHNRFENNRRPGENFNGTGLLSLRDPRVSWVVEGNFFLFNDGGVFSCISVSGNRDPAEFRVHRNYFGVNSNLGFTAPPGGAVMTIGLGEGICEYNAFVDNIDHAFDTWEFGSVGHALRNWWGDITGPYVEIEHHDGRGDTTDAETIYDEWLESADEIPDTSLYPSTVLDEPTIPSTWNISKIYPNPFNSEFRIDLTGITGADFEVRLYDLLGREVALLHSGRTVGGTLSFSAPPNLATGLYFLRASDRAYTVATDRKSVV